MRKNKLIKVNIGCGKYNFGKDWKHIDSEEYSHVSSKDIFLNYFKDNSINIIYSSHFLDYFDRTEVIFLLKLWCSKLKEGGKIYLSVPDFKSMSHLYNLNHIPLHKFLGPLYGKIENNGKFIYHKTVYDYSSLGELLRFAGFKRIDIWQHNSGDNIIPFDTKDDCSNAKIDGQLISLNIEATK